MSGATVTLTLPREVAERVYEWISDGPYEQGQSPGDFLYVLLADALGVPVGGGLRAMVEATWAA